MRRPTPVPAAPGVLARGVFAVAVLVSFAVLFAPADDVPSSPPGVDKAVHLLLFAALAVSGRWAGARPAVLAAALVAYAAVSEVVQGLPALGRSASVADGVADVAGVLAGLLLWSRAGRRRPA
ncbi:VanZ family protein [Geodermatophilus sp. DSM 44513]|uniref:VanZ family protein n=1 Tax=Geodermatophilus sp. DSM 44513 TaxID=1528104 RepID=UPI0012766084|nr:VanZ family protein [Geodermatophilus sp. DSM 44513]WNV74407.1 VanZ family protein [Geodermatophilus sp. DSM 44513]